MYSTKGYTELTKEFILSRVSEYDIFKYYLPNFTEIGRSFCSSLRDDKHPSCSIKDYGDGLIYKDFATGEKYTPIRLVEAKYSCDFLTALGIIARDFNLINTPIQQRLVETQVNRVPNIIDKEKRVINVKIREWNKGLDYDYWNNYGIKLSSLQRFKVFPISEFWIKNYNFKCKLPTYAYYFGEGKFKIMSPLEDRSKKWYGNTDHSDLQGWNQLPESGDLLIITSSLKDVMLLYQLGYTAVAPQAETDILPKERILELESRFSQLLIFYDNDGMFHPPLGTAGKGKEAARKNSELYNIPTIFLPDDEEKDISDYYKANGLEKTETIMKRLLNE